MNREEFKLKFIEQFRAENGIIRVLPLIGSSYGVFRKHMNVSCSEYKLAIDIWWDDVTKNFSFEFTDEEVSLSNNNDITRLDARFYRRKHFIEFFGIQGSCIKFGYYSGNLNHENYEYFMKDKGDIIGLTIDLSTNRIAFYACKNMDEFSNYVHEVMFGLSSNPKLAYRITQKDVDACVSLLQKNIGDKEIVTFVADVLTDEMNYRGDSRLLETMTTMIEKLEVMIKERT